MRRTYRGSSNLARRSPRPLPTLSSERRSRNTAAKYWAKYLVIDRAIEHWDGPTNFRWDEERKGSSTHNFFMYVDDREASKRELRIVPWDLDNVLTSPDNGQEMVGNRGAWDKPICGEGQTEGCVECSPFTSTGGLSQSMRPGCFRLLRAFMRPLRDEYMQAAEEALAGPAKACKMKAKLDRWADTIRAEMATDVDQGLYPVASY